MASGESRKRIRAELSHDAHVAVARDAADSSSGKHVASEHVNGDSVDAADLASLLSAVDQSEAGGDDNGLHGVSGASGASGASSASSALTESSPDAPSRPIAATSTTHSASTASDAGAQSAIPPKHKRTIDAFCKSRGGSCKSGAAHQADAAAASGNVSAGADDQLARTPPPPSSAAVDPTSLEASLDAPWRRVLQHHFATESWRALSAFVKRECGAGNKRVFPPASLTFRAFALCPWHRVKVVILGQDPYHGPGQAHGLCFSVPRGVPPPPSLVNVFDELQREFPGGRFQRPSHGCLEAWAAQGVLLLNATLTVEAYKANSHSPQGGWLKFTDEVIKAVNVRKRGVVFMLWGRSAQQKGARVDAKRHLVLRASHPSPLSANRGGWFGNGHFAAANEHLRQHGAEPIDWAAINSSWNGGDGAGGGGTGNVSSSGSGSINA